MKLRSINFLQSLWDIELQQDELLQICKNAMMSDIERTYMGVLNKKTIWVSQKARALLGRINTLKKRVPCITRPIDLCDINDEFLDITGQIRALQIKTAQTLDAPSGVLLKDLHIIVRQLQPYTGEKIYEQVHYQLYRLLISGCRIPEHVYHVPDAKDIRGILNYYIQQLMPLLNSLDTGKLDGRWAYERKKVLLNGELSIEQFISVEPKPAELKQPLGIPDIGVGDNGEFRIYGRGLITNLTPMEINDRVIHSACRRLPEITDFSVISNENINPMDLLACLFSNRKFLVTSNDYFELINRKLLASEVYQRVNMGSCIYCGSPLYANVCSKCGRKWDFYL